MKTINIGLIGVGLDTYWKQFEGLEDRLIGYQEEIAERMRNMDANIINIPIIDNQVKAKNAIKIITDGKIELLFVFISTYALSSTILPIVQRCKVPVIILNIQPTSRIDFDYINSLGDRGKMTGEWLAYCQACSVPDGRGRLIFCLFLRTFSKCFILLYMKRELEIYVHIPFCAKKCDYCDFLSAPAGEDVQSAYVEQLIREKGLEYHQIVELVI